MSNKIKDFYRKYKILKHKNIKTIIVLKCILFLLILLFFVFFKWLNYYPSNINLEHDKDYFGVTFSTKYSEDLGLDYKEVYNEILTDLKVKKIRIPIYWDEIEKNNNNYNFEKYDYLINEGEKYDVDYVVSIGRRVPRWPECHSPHWLINKNEKEVELETLEMIEKVVKHYKDRESVEYWQIENEPFLSSFGVCPPLNEDLLKKEFKLVENLDDREKIITSSGELTFWGDEAEIGDIFGSTVYKIVYNSWFGFIKYPFPGSFYKLKAKMAGIDLKDMMILELQTEPWVVDGNITQLNQEQINKSLSIEQFRANLQYSINLDLNRVYTWGVEWWYFEKLYGNPEYWEIAKELF
ncbi:MAG: hypothetical protein PF488_02415 [Patescibacteria group bacterium]|jgi:hypothetical protein|nr:hypothetical protein [Patescibacteria group bacterium]